MQGFVSKKGYEITFFLNAEWAQSKRVWTRALRSLKIKT